MTVKLNFRDDGFLGYVLVSAMNATLSNWSLTMDFDVDHLTPSYELLLRSIVYYQLYSTFF